MSHVLEKLLLMNCSAVKKFVTNFRLCSVVLVGKWSFYLGKSVEKCQLSTSTEGSNSSSEKIKDCNARDRKIIIAKMA